MEKAIGKISHYYTNVGVGVLDLTGTISIGDRIKVKKGETEFEQAVESMQIEHDPVKKAKKGDSVGLKLDEKVKPGAAVYKVTA